MARENLTRLKNPDKGYTPRLLDRMGAVLPACLKNRVRIVSNMGAANPPAAARDVRRHARDSGLGDVRCAVVLGDDVAEILRRQPQLPLMESGEPLESLLPKMISGNAYLGADVICRGAGDRRAGRDHRPSRRPLAVRRAGDAPLRLALRRLAAAGGRYRRRPPARVRRPGERRLLRRSRQEGRAGPRAPRLSVRRRDGRRRRSGSPRSRAPAAAWTSPPARSSSCTSCTIPRRTSPRTASSTSPTSRWRRTGATESVSAGARRGRARRPTRSRSATTTASSARARSRTPASTPWRRRSGRRRSSSSGSRTAA